MATTDKKLASIETPILILVEGITDKDFIDRFLSNLDCLKDVKEKFTIYPAGSYEKIGSYLKNIKSIRGLHQLKVLAVIADADESPLHRNQEIVTEYADLRDVTFQKMQMLLPNASEAGALESLVLKTLSTEDLNCAVAYVACVEGSTALNTAQRDKLMMYAWTSQQQKEPVTNFMRVKRNGARVVDVNHVAFDPIVQFLKKLADSCSPKS